MRMFLVGCCACIAPLLIARLAFADDAARKSDGVTIGQTDAGYRFRSGNRVVLFYQQAAVTEHDHTRAGYVHPPTRKQLESGNTNAYLN